MTDVSWTRNELRRLETWAKAIVETGVRDTQIEDLHAGVWPTTETGDYSDVKVVTPDGDIPWAAPSRISDEEMKALMIEVVDRVFTVLRYPEELMALRAAERWNRPRLDPHLMKTVRLRRARRRAGQPLTQWRAGERLT